MNIITLQLVGYKYRVITEHNGHKKIKCFRWAHLHLLELPLTP